MGPVIDNRFGRPSAGGILNLIIKGGRPLKQLGRPMRGSRS
jgi:hypothetical protein